MINQKIIIPKGWKVKKFKDLLDYERPDKYIVKSTEYQKNFKTPVLTANKSFIKGYTNEEFGICRDLPVIIFDDFTTDSKYVDFPFKIKSSAIKILRSKSEHANLKFLFEIIKSIHFPVGNHKRYYISEYQDIDVAVPPWNEQKKIAEILSKIDENIEKTEEVIKNTEKLKKGLMGELLTKGIGHKKFKKTKLGEIPEEWGVVELSKIADVERGKFSHRPRNNPKFYNGDYPFIQTGEVVNSNGRIKKYRQTLNNDGLAISRIFKKGTIVVTIAANIGDTGILEFDSCFPDSLVGITVKEKMNNIFLEYYLRTRKIYLNSIATHSAQKNINLEKLKPLLVIKPGLFEQKQIAEILSSVDDKIQINKQIKNKLTQLKKGLMQDLLSGRVRV